MGLLDFIMGKKAGNHVTAESKNQSDKQDDSFIKFDNLTFKLAVIEELMYEQKLINSTSEFGDRFFEKYPDYETVDEKEEIRRLKEWEKDILLFYENMKIPSEFAAHVKKVYVGEENKVYYNVNPQWLDYDEYFDNGKQFIIADVSEEEMRQFPNLKTFVFNMYDSPAPELVEKLRKHGYEVEVNG